jgi:hypothetical protein
MDERRQKSGERRERREEMKEESIKKGRK